MIDRSQKVEMGYMKVTCPKCQFENQADSSRVVCARCATIIEVRMDQGFDSNGKRQTARLPFTSGGLSNPSQSLSNQRFNQSDVYATRIGDDFDDVLDVPIQPQSSYQPVDDTPQAPIFEDVFTGQNQDQPSPYDFNSYDKPSAPLDSFVPGATRAPQEFVEPAEQDFVGWHVLPEDAEEEEEEAKSGRGGLFLRLGLIIGLFGVVVFWGYYFLGNYIGSKIGLRKSRATAQKIEKADKDDREDKEDADTKVANNESPSKQASESANSNSDEKSQQEGGQPSEPPQNNKPISLPPAEKASGVVKAKESPKLQDPVSTSVGEASSKGSLTVQVGSFKDQGEADARASSLNAATGGQFRVVRAEIPGRGVWYRVQQVDGFASREAALTYGNRLRARNLISDFIVTGR